LRRAVIPPICCAFQAIETLAREFAAIKETPHMSLVNAVKQGDLALAKYLVGEQQLMRTAGSKTMLLRR